jgi:SAM-dependent methyltransferase
VLSCRGARSACYTPAIPPDEFSLQDIEFHRQTAEAYDREITEEFAVYHRYLLEPYLDRLARDLSSAHALDLGCGTGVVSLALAKRGFEVIGIDHSLEMLAIAQAKASAADLNGSCRFITGDVRDLPASDGEFDVVTCQGLLHHLDGSAGCLRELDRVLRPDGFFYISEPCRDATPLKRALLTLWHLRPGRGTDDDADKALSVEEPLSADQLRSQLRELGLQFEMELLTHLRPLQGKVSEGMYLRVVRLVSAPWRRRRGDLLFVFGRKPEMHE